MQRRNLVRSAGALAALAGTGQLLRPKPVKANGVWVPAPLYQQQRSLSCEYASAIISMAAYGAWKSEYAFDALVGWAPNPHRAYRGNITGEWGNTTDYGVYAEPMAWALPHFGFAGDLHYASGDASFLTSHLDLGEPVIVWLGFWGSDGFYEYDEDGSAFRLVPGYHVVVANAYDANSVTVSDPARNAYRTWSWGDFMWMWDALGGMAVAVRPQ